jgi:hypothetical protein
MSEPTGWNEADVLETFNLVLTVKTYAGGRSGTHARRTRLFRKSGEPLLDQAIDAAVRESTGLIATARRPAGQNLDSLIDRIDREK